MIVLDASVIIKALVEDEDGHSKARELVEKGGVVPDWLFVEVGNAVATKTSFTGKEAKEMLELIYDIGFEVKKIERKWLMRAMELAKQSKVSVYDMIYAVLAQELGMNLVTADVKFAQKTKFDFVKVLS